MSLGEPLGTAAKGLITDQMPFVSPSHSLKAVKVQESLADARVTRDSNACMKALW